MGNMKSSLLIWSSLLALLAVGACSVTEEEEGRGDRRLARVHNKNLYISEMEGMFPEGTTSEDSVAIITTYVNRWIREAVLLAEAEANVPPDLNLDKLVRDYRASLVRNNYEQILVQELMDSTITQEELTSFYEENQLLYELETPIIRCYFIKVPLPTPEAEQLRRLWNSNDPNDLQALRDYCEQYAELALLEDSLWYSVEELSNELPTGTLTTGNIGSKQEFTQRDEHHQYYFRLFERRNRKEIAPLSYVEDQARKVILHKRKLQLMEQAKEDMYQRELRENNIETYFK